MVRRLRLEDPTFSASYWAVRGVWRRWCKERGVRAEDVAIPIETGPDALVVAERAQLADVEQDRLERLLLEGQREVRARARMALARSGTSQEPMLPLQRSAE